VAWYKFRSIIIICALIFNIFVISNNSDLAGIDRQEGMVSASPETIYPIVYRGRESWEPFEILSEPIQGFNFNTRTSYALKIAVEGDKIYTVWRDDSDINGAGTDRDIFYRYFNGSSWSDIQVISEEIEGQNNNIGNSFDQADIAVENGNIYVVWGDINDTNNAGTDSDIFFRCNLTGTSWEPIQVISEPVLDQNINTGDSDNSKIAVENGRLYVQWSDTNDTNGAGTDRDIFYRYFNGSSWSDIQVISEPVFGQNYNTGNFQVDHGDIAVDNGKLYVVWADYNNTNGAGIDDDIHYRCNLTGTSWEPIQVRYM